MTNAKNFTTRFQYRLRKITIGQCYQRKFPIQKRRRTDCNVEEIPRNKTDYGRAEEN